MKRLLRTYGPALALALAIPVTTACEKYVEVRTEKYSAAGCSSIDVATVSGDVSTYPVDGDSLIAEITITSLRPRTAREVRVVFTPGTRASLETRAPSGLLSTAEVSVSLGVPRGVAAGDLRSTNGDVLSTDMNHAGSLGTTNGDISMSGCTGTASLSTTNGDILVSGGQVVITRASTTNGDITLDAWTPPSGGASFGTVNGDVSVAFPESLDCVVDASTTNGTVQASGLQLSGDLGGKGGRLTLGDGGPEVELRTVNGSVSITRRMDL